MNWHFKYGVLHCGHVGTTKVIIIAGQIGGHVLKT